MYRTKWGRKQGNMVQYIGFDKILYMHAMDTYGTPNFPKFDILLST